MIFVVTGPEVAFLVVVSMIAGAALWTLVRFLTREKHDPFADAKATTTWKIFDIIAGIIKQRGTKTIENDLFKVEVVDGRITKIWPKQVAVDLAEVGLLFPGQMWEKETKR